ncbi:MAG: glycosyltransferase family A protein [Pseudomonadota bacterium]
MTERPAVSVVLPVHNRETLVGRAIESVLAQDLADFELLVIDDCSTDGTVAAVERYTADARVRLVRNETNLGPSGARNRGIELARGRYIAFQDSDDRWFPEKLAIQIAALERDPTVRACFCGALYYASEQCYYIPGPETLDEAGKRSGDLSSTVLYRNPVTPQALLVHRELFDEVGPFDATLRVNEDWELVIRMAQATRFAFVEEPLAIIYRTANSVSSDLVANTAVRKRLLGDYEALYDKHPAARAWQNYIIGKQSIENRHYKASVAHFRQSMRDKPSLLCLMHLQRARFLAMTRS